jgi:hypothetical protein
VTADPPLSVVGYSVSVSEVDVMELDYGAGGATGTAAANTYNSSENAPNP